MFCARPLFAIRTKAFPLGLPKLTPRERSIADLANVIVANTMLIARRFVEEGAAVSIENPKASTLWSTPYFQTLEGAFQDVSSVDVDYCMFGEPYKKSTRLVVFHAHGDANFLAPLSIRCDGLHEHVGLSGWRSLDKPKVMRPTKGTAAYPGKLCVMWAMLVKKYLDGVL
jgi:hypothetical protein